MKLGKTVREQLLAEWEQAHSEKEAIASAPTWTLSSMIEEAPLSQHRGDRTDATDTRSPEELLLQQEAQDDLTGTQWSPLRSETGIHAEKAWIAIRKTQQRKTK